MTEDVMKEKNCANCQAVLDTDAVFCNECGLVQPETAKSNTKICPRCGREMKQVNKFCPGCAFDFSSPEPASAVQSSPAPAQKISIPSVPSIFDVGGISRTEIPVKPADRLTALKNRYKDGYRVAAAIEAFGLLLKVAGSILGGLMILTGFSIGFTAAQASRNSMFNSGDGTAAFISSVFIFGVVGIIIAAISWIFGVMVSAQGQLLKANLDCAVNSSPFLTDMSKAEIMSLPSS